MTQVKAARRLWGSIAAVPHGVEIRGLGSLETIPYDRIASVQTSWWHATIELETGAQTRTIAIWNPFRLGALAQAIRDGFMAGRGFRIPTLAGVSAIGFDALMHDAANVVRVDDGGPGEFGTYRKRDGSAYEDLEPEAGR